MDNNNQFDTNGNSSDPNSDVNVNGSDQDVTGNTSDSNMNGNNSDPNMNGNNSQQGGYENSNTGSYYGQKKDDQSGQNGYTGQNGFYGGPYDMHSSGYNGPQNNGPQNNGQQNWQQNGPQNGGQQNWQQNGPQNGPQNGQFKPYSTGFGITSLILGIASIILFWLGITVIGGILAIVFGAVQIGKNKNYPGTGNGVPIGGIVCGIIGIILTISFYTILILGIFRSGLADTFRHDIENNNGSYEYNYGDGDNPFNFDDYDYDIPDQY